MFGRRSPRLGALGAIALPAVAAAAAVLLTGGSSQPPRAPGAHTAAGLARAAAIQKGTPAPSAPKPHRPAPPRWISIPAAGVAARVESVGARRGVLRVPDVGVAGWYSGGPRPGEAGRAVIIGHLDTKRGPGLFARVPRLAPGSSLSVTDTRGDLWTYEVIGMAQVHKDDFPAEAVYGGSARPVLVLITCGGPFSEDDGYRDNVLVYARPT